MTTVSIEETLPPLLTNSDAISGRYPYTFASHYILDRDLNGQRVVEVVDSRAAIVMSPTTNKRVWLKSEFMKLADPNCNPDLKNQAQRDFQVGEGNLRNLCTVGCGTNVIFRFSNGLFYAAVERTAPQKTDTGSVNAGLYSRAAGSSTGDIDLTAFRELNEEMFIVIQDGSEKRALHVIPDIYHLDSRAQKAILQTRQDRFPSILAAHGETGLSLVNPFEVVANALSVPGLTETIVERRTGLNDKVLASRVFGYAPHQMDINGIDSVVLVDLAHLPSSAVLGIWDGEQNQKAELLKRNWSLMPLDEIHSKMVLGEIKMSPVPGRVIMAAHDVRDAIHSHLGLK